MRKLYKEGITTAEIKRELDYSSPNLMPEIKFLKEQGFIDEDSDRVLTLTNFGKIVVDNYVPLLETLDVLREDEEYWKRHDLDPIPRKLRSRLKDFGDFKITTNSVGFEPDEEFIENLAKSRDIRGVAPILHSKYPPLFAKLAQKGCDVSLVLTESIVEEVNENYAEDMEVYMGSESTELYMVKDARISFAVTDVFLSMGLFHKNGGFDPQHDVVSYEDSAIEWGRELFQTYVDKAERVSSL